MMMLKSESLLESKHISKCVAVVDKVLCPICCVPFQGVHRPMVSCENRHTICIRCMDLIINKTLSTPEPTSALCPICRQRIQLPIESNQEMREFLQLISLFHQTYRQAEFYDLYKLKVQRLEREGKQKDQQIASLRRKVKSDEEAIQMLRVRNDQLSDKIRRMEKLLPKDKENDEDLFNINEGMGKKLPLGAFIDGIPNDTHLNLAKKDFSVTMVEHLVLYDLTKLVEVNLNFNQLGDEGLYTLLRESYMPQLKSLKLCNNRITKLPSFRYLTQLEELDVGNYQLDTSTYNRIGGASVEMLFEHKWEKLRSFGIQFQNDLVWEQEGFVTKFVEYFPVVSKIELSQMKTRISKARCQRIKSLINNKAKRPNSNKIMILQKNM